MLCPKCNMNLSDGSKFCPYCGSNLDSTVLETVNQVKSNPIVIDESQEVDTRKKSKAPLIIIIILLLLGLLAFCYFYFKPFDNDIGGDKPDSNASEKANGNGTSDVDKKDDNNDTDASDSEYETSFKNYNIDVTMDLEIAGAEVTTKAEGTVDEVNQTEYLKSDITTMGLTVSNEIYHDYASGVTYMTEPYGSLLGDRGVWWKQQGASRIVDLKGLVKKMISMDGVTKVSDNYYKVKMSSDDIEDLAKSAGDTVGSIASGDVFADVYTENGYVIRIEYDFTELLKGATKFTAVIKFSNYDKAGDVIIPQDVINNAK